MQRFIVLMVSLTQLCRLATAIPDRDSSTTFSSPSLLPLPPSFAPLSIAPPPSTLLSVNATSGVSSELQLLIT